MNKLFKFVMIATFATFALASCEDVPAPFTEPGQPEKPDTPDPPADGGTWNAPFTVAELISNQTGSTVWVHGYIVGSIPESAQSATLANMTFTADGAHYANICIAESATETDASKCVPVQLPAGSDARDMLNLKNNPTKLGTEVWLKGTAEKYCGAPGMKGVSKFTLAAPTEDDDKGSGSGDNTPAEGAQGNGSLENPFNPAAALNYTSALPAGETTTDKFYIKGIVCESSKMDISTQYKNATFHISEDGTNKGAQFLIFRTKGLNGADITSADDVKVGDEVVVYAALVNYMGNTPETAQGGIIYSLKRNGENQNPGSGDEGNGDTDNGDTQESNESHFTATDLGVGDKQELTTATAFGVTVSATKGSSTTTPKYDKNGANIRIYPGNTLTITTSKNISSVKLSCTAGSVAGGSVTSDKGEVNVTDPSITISNINDKTFTITNNCKSSGIPAQIRIETFDITYTE